MNMRGIFSIALLAAILLLVCATPATYAQNTTTGDVTGTVTDSTGAVVPGAKLVLKNQDTGDTRTAESSGNGTYRFSLLKPGNYQLSATTPGLKSDLGRVIVAVGQALNVDLVMRPEDAKEVVMVNDAAPLLQTDNANMTATYSSRQVELLPAPGGDITTVAFTVPGVVVSTGAGYGNFSSHGLPGTSNLFTTNGNDNMDPYLNLNNSGASNLSLGSNEIQEASVVQNAYSAQYGRQAGAQINFITKSGSNAFHGNLLYNYNGSFLNANDFFANSSGTPRGRAISNQYGALLSGPIKKNKLFFLVDTEGLRYILPTSGIVSTPSVALQNYILKTVSAAQVPIYQKAFALYNGAPGSNRKVSVQNGDGLLQDSNGALGCGGLAGTPTGVAGQTFGTNVSCADAFGTNVSNQNSEWLFAVRGDYNISDKQKLFLRFKTDHGVQPTSTDPINSNLNAISTQPSFEGQANYTFVITPRLVNNFIGSSSWYSAIFGPADLQSTLNTFPQQWAFFDGGANGTGSITQLGLSLDTFPQGRRVGQLQLVDDLSYVIGKHTIKVGVNYRYNRVTDTGNQRLVAGGRYRFFDLSEFASGVIDPNSGSSYTQRFTPFPVVHLRLGNLGAYIQDEWAVTSSVKVTLGLRLDHTSNPNCTDNCFARENSPFATLNKGVTIPYNQSITTGFSNAFYDMESVVPQPRLGVVYNPSWSKNTVIRGGVGLFADLFAGTIASGIFGNSPNVFTPALRFGTVNTSGTGSSPASAALTGQAFQSGFAGGSTLAQLQSALAPVAFTPPAYTTLPSTVNNPKYLEWSFEVQQQFGPKNVVVLSYVGNHGYDEFLRNANVNGNSTTGFGGLPTAAPDPRFRIVTDITNSGWSNYNGLSAEYRRGFSYGFSGRVGYTWSHALDTISNGGLGEYFSFNDSLTTQINPFSVRALNYGSSDYDVRHSFTADFLWEMPFKSQNKMIHNILGGWALSSKWYARTSTPFSVYNSTKAGQVAATLGGTVLADVIAPVNTSCGTSIDTPCFTTAQFQTGAKQNDFGNLPRNAFRGPGYFDTDVNLFKTFPIHGERMKLYLGANAFNLLNHPNFANPGGNVAVGGLGSITQTVAPPTSPYGSFQGSAVSGRVLVLTGRFTF